MGVIFSGSDDALFEVGLVGEFLFGKGLFDHRLHGTEMCGFDRDVQTLAVAVVIRIQSKWEIINNLL